MIVLLLSALSSHLGEYFIFSRVIATLGKFLILNRIIASFGFFFFFIVSRVISPLWLECISLSLVYLSPHFGKCLAVSSFLVPHCQPGLSLHFGDFSHNSDSRSSLVSVSLSVIKYLMALLWELAIGESVLQCLRFELPCCGQFCARYSIVHHVFVVCYVYLYALHFTLSLCRAVSLSLSVAFSACLSLSVSFCLFFCLYVCLCLCLSLSPQICESAFVLISSPLRIKVQSINRSINQSINLSLCVWIVVFLVCLGLFAWELDVKSIVLTVLIPLPSIFFF